MARVLIAGCGYVGGRLADMLRDDGREVIALRRHPRDVPPSVTAIAADLTDPRSLRGIPSKVEEVVYAVGSDARTEEAYDRAYVQGIRNLLQALQAGGHPVRRIVYVSSTGVYAQDDGSVVDEESEAVPGGPTAARLLLGERLVAEGPYPAVVVRLGGIYGPGRERTIHAVRAGTATLTGEKVWTNRIHRDDCAGVVRHVLRLADPASLYLGVDTEPTVQDDVVRWLAETLRISLPVGSELSARHPRGKRCSSDRLRTSGYSFLYPTFRDGYGALLSGAP